MVHSDTIWNEVLEVGNAEKKMKARGSMVNSDTIWNDVLDVLTAKNVHYQMFGPDVIFKRLFRVVYTILYFENGIP